MLWFWIILSLQLVLMLRVSPRNYGQIIGCETNTNNTPWYQYGLMQGSGPLSGHCSISKTSSHLSLSSPSIWTSPPICSTVSLCYPTISHWHQAHTAWHQGPTDTSALMKTTLDSNKLLMKNIPLLPNSQSSPMSAQLYNCVTYWITNVEILTKFGCWYKVRQPSFNVAAVIEFLVLMSQLFYSKYKQQSSNIKIMSDHCSILATKHQWKYYILLTSNLFWNKNHKMQWICMNLYA